MRVPNPGTAAYMAPELLQAGKMTRACDVYSFAMIMVELFTCRRLFEGLQQQQVRAPRCLLFRACSDTHLAPTVQGASTAAGVCPPLPVALCFTDMHSAMCFRSGG